MRDAERADTKILLDYIRKKFDFDRNLGVPLRQLQATTVKLEESMFGESSFAHALLLEDDDSPLAFALYYFRFSSFAARPSLWLDDLYVDEGRRREGAGAHLMRQLARIAERRDCTHLAWIVDDRNVEGMKFYRKLGAELAGTQDHTVALQITPGALLAGTCNVRCVA